MFRSPWPLYAACGVTTLLALTPLATLWRANSDEGPIGMTDGRVQLAVDEQDVGEVDPDVSLEVCFLVSNVGSERLVLRQAGWLPEGGARRHCRYVVSPGRTIAVPVQLNSNELASRGRKHVQFETSDRTLPELWLTVRGHVAGFGDPVHR